MKTTSFILAVFALLPLAAGAQNMAVAESINVPVLKAAVQKGDSISADNIMEQPTAPSQIFASTITSSAQLVGLQAVRPLSPGQPINKLHVRVAPDIARDSMVDIRFTRGTIQLTAKGQVLEDGQIGQTVKVLNPATRATLVGVLRSGGIVDIN